MELHGGPRRDVPVFLRHPWREYDERHLGRAWDGRESDAVGHPARHHRRRDYRHRDRRRRRGRDDAPEETRSLERVEPQTREDRAERPDLAGVQGPACATRVLLRLRGSLRAWDRDHMRMSTEPGQRHLGRRLAVSLPDLPKLPDQRYGGAEVRWLE